MDTLKQISSVKLSRTSGDLIVPLRHLVLRPGKSIDEVIFPEDKLESSRHYGAFASDKKLIACASLLRSTWCGDDAWQLRAMAVIQEWQRTGLGTRLLQMALNDLRCDNLEAPIWCHARVGASKFYENLGWEPVGDVFENGNAGPSVKMVRLTH